MNKINLKTDNLQIGIKIKKLRETQNLSQPDLAEYLGIAQSTLCKIESGETKKINFTLMIKISEIFNVNINYFMENNSSPKGSYTTTSTLDNSMEKALNEISCLILKLNKSIKENHNKDFLSE